MRQIAAKVLRVVRNVLCVLAALLLLFLLVRFIGTRINGRTPSGGINESMYVEINGTKQWISIYGEDIDNPVLLYLHGGPGSSTSAFDYAFTRKWADVYTVVTWDQRNCGKSCEKGGDSASLTYDLMMDDGLAVTQYLIDYLDVEKIALLGHSWGTYYGCNLVLAHPEYYSCYIGAGQLVDMYENEVAFQEAAAEWAGNEEEALELLKALTPDRLTPSHFEAKNRLMEKYGYGMMRDGSDYSLPAAIIFNPYYSLADWIDYLSADPSVYMDFIVSDEFDRFSLTGRAEYTVPFYNINGDCDYQTNYQLAQNYFEEIDAPYKKLCMMEDTTHGLLESKSEAFSDILHEIAVQQNTIE